MTVNIGAEGEAWVKGWEAKEQGMPREVADHEASEALREAWLKGYDAAERAGR